MLSELNIYLKCCNIYLCIQAYVDSDTVNVDSVQHVRLLAKHKMKSGKKQRYHDAWPTGVGDYLKFIVLKENVDTMNAVNILCKVMRSTNHDSIHFAGTKDKRAVTAQWCTMYRRRPSAISRINTYTLPPTIRVGNFEYGGLCTYIIILLL